MIKLKIILTVFAFSIVFNGCDGLTIRKAMIDLTNINTTSSTTRLQPDNLDAFFQLIEKVANKNGLNCNPYNENEKFFGCGIGTFNLMTYVKGDKLVEVELREFGPWGKTKRFEKLEKDVNQMLAQEFPGRNYILREEPRRPKNATK